MLDDKVSLLEFLEFMGETVPYFCLFLGSDDDYYREDDTGKIQFLLNILHEESFCGGECDPQGGEQYLSLLKNAVYVFRDRINTLYDYGVM